MKKTLEEYKQEFSKRPDNQMWGDYTKKEKHEKEINEYLQIVKDCIADYPDENMGYQEYGEFIGENFSNDELLIKPTEELSELVKKDKRYIKTLEFLIPKLTDVGTMSSEAIRLIYREETKEFANVYFLCGNSLVGMGLNKDAANEYETAVELGIDYNPFIADLNPPIYSIEIANAFCIKNIKIDNLDDCKEIYFLGENGVGKTLLLQSIINRMNGEEGGINLTWEKLYADFEYLNFFAYGVNRFRTGLINDEDFDEEGYGTLFNRNAKLIDVEWWLKDIQRKESVGKNPLSILTTGEMKASKISLKTITDLITHIVNFDDTADLKIAFDLEKDKFVFIERGTPINFENVADGYRSVMIWLCDLLRRLIENQPYIENLDEFYGVVLVDEVDMFLHPKWEYTIVKKLREKLPNIQWFFTTHSPMLILGASEDAVFYKLYKENGITKISEQMKCKDFDNLLSNALITSPLFDMDTARMSSFAKSEKELDTSRDYVESRLRIKIDEKISIHKKTHQNIDRSEIDALIDQAIDELTNTAADDTRK